LFIAFQGGRVGRIIQDYSGNQAIHNRRQLVKVIQEWKGAEVGKERGSSNNRKRIRTLVSSKTHERLSNLAKVKGCSMSKLLQDMTQSFLTNRR